MEINEFGYIVMTLEELEKYRNSDIKCPACEAGIPRKVIKNGTKNIQQKKTNCGKNTRYSFMSLLLVS